MNYMTGVIQYHVEYIFGVDSLLIIEKLIQYDLI
jgi:hypothetical protein